VCDEVVLQPGEGEPTVEERFFDGLFGTVCSSVVSEFSPDSVQTLMEQGFGGAEGKVEDHEGLGIPGRPEGVHFEAGLVWGGAQRRASRLAADRVHGGCL
jgi:hypothetical protein